ncbi:MAG: hypothetical protein ACM3QZ_05865 [Solirubrobacterales bacterium]
MKTPFESRQETIQRLRQFLEESVNLEPELSLFIQNLIGLLDPSSTGPNGQKSAVPPVLFGEIPKAEH